MPGQALHSPPCFDVGLGGLVRYLAVCARQCLVENTPRDHIGRRYGLDDFAGREDSSQSGGCVALFHVGLRAPQCISIWRGPLLRDHFIQWTSSHSRAENFRKVILRLEMKVVVATKHLEIWPA